jgi:hypothetical protein
MKSGRNGWFLVIVTGCTVLALLGSPRATAAETERTFALVSGFIDHNIRDADQANYQVIPLGLRIPLYEKDGVWPLCGRFSITLEPFVGYAFSPDDDFEAGLPLQARYALPLGCEGVRLYVEGGFGGVYTTADLADTTNWNFLEQLGAGLAFELTESLGLEVGYRFRHISNGGLGDINGGLNGHGLHLGLVCSF